MKRLILLVGIPGSGKSTIAQRLVPRGFNVLSADSIRQELWGNAADQRDPEKVFAVLFKQMEELMAQGADIVVDNTNLNVKQRKPFLDRATKYGYTDIQLWLLDMPLDLCLERNRSRDRAVPDDIVANMFMELNRAGRPKNAEGRLVIIRPGKDDNDFRFFFPQHSA